MLLYIKISWNSLSYKEILININISQIKIKMEEEKKTGAAYMERRRQEIISSKASDIEMINSARLGTDDYDFNSVNIIKEGGQAIVFEIRCNIDGKKYAAKRLHYQIGSHLNSRNTQAEAEREIGCLRALNHPMVTGILDLIKDNYNFPCIIME